MSATRGIIEINGKKYLLAAFDKQSSIEIADAAQTVMQAVDMYEHHDFIDKAELTESLNNQRENIYCWLDRFASDMTICEILPAFDEAFPELDED